MSGFTMAQRAEIEGTCRQLMMRYAASLDLNDIDGLVDVFAPELVWERPGMAPMHSHAEIRTFFSHLWAQRHAQNRHWFDVHMLTTCSIEVESDELARGSTWCVMYSAPDADGQRPAVMPERPELIVLYRDVFGPAAGGWRILEHRATHLFRSPDYKPPEIPASLRKEQP